MNKAIVYVLEQQDWKAGDHNIAFQACDGARPSSRSGIRACSANANAYKGNEKLIGLVGTFNSAAPRSRSRC